MGPLSGDLRKRVVWAVCAEGVSCRASARRFGVSFSGAIRWVAALHERGSYAPLPMGGDTRSRRVEAHADFCLAFIGASLTLRSTKSASVWSVREARKCRRR